MKLIRHSHMVEELAAMRIPYALAYLSAAIEIVCGPGLIIGIWHHGVAAVSAAILFFVMIGASIANFYGRDASYGFGVIVVFMVPLAFVAYFFRDPGLSFIGL